MSVLFIVLAAFGFFAIIQLTFYLGIFTRVIRWKESTNENRPPVSVIICARNNRKFLEDNLLDVLRQDYPDFEVVVVNDGSTDGTIDFLDNLKKDESRLKVLHLDIDERFHRGKKFAQTIGIKGAKNDVLVFTDADCKPSSNQWLKNTVKEYSNQTEIVLGVANYNRKIGLTNWIVQLETFHTHLLYLNFALAKMPYMGVGRNLSYKRPLFFSVKGFASHQHLLSGDDDLFVNETATKSNTSVCLNPDARTLSEPPRSLGAWVRQKKRHFSTGKLYRAKHKLMLFLYSFSLLMFYLTAVPGILMSIDVMATTPDWLYTVIGLIGLRFLVQAIVLYGNMKKLDYLKYYVVFPLMDIGILLIQIFIGIQGYFSKPKRWNS